MVYCFRCPACNNRTEHFRKDEPILCGPCFRNSQNSIIMIRDWQSEGIGIGAGARVSRDGTESEIAQLFLPNNDEFKGPGDPDGTIGMRQWHSSHRGKSGSSDRSLVPGRIDKRVF